MSYVDGFVLPLPADKIELYRAMAEKAGKIWIEHGALSYHECIAEDVDAKNGMVAFPDIAKVKSGEIVVFAYIVFKSRMHRDEVNAKVMADERLKDTCQDMPFDFRRMAYGGFQSIVHLGAQQ